MRTIILFCILLFCYSLLKAQSDATILENTLIGIWQAESNEESAAWLESYTFTEKSRFIFRTSQYDGLRRIIGIIGNYRINKDLIYFKADSIIETYGGHIERSKFETLNDSWSFENEEIKTVKIQSNEESAIIELCDRNKTNTPCIMIDKRIFYRIKTDPKEY